MPDWRNLDDYAYCHSLTGDLWAWEFLRRNPEYREEWHRFQETWRALEAEYGQPPNRDFERWRQDPRAYVLRLPRVAGQGCAAQGERVLIECALGERWGLHKFPLDPAKDLPQVPEELLWREERPDVRRVSADLDAHAEPGGGVMALGFDLSLPLKPQLEQARSLLLAEQRRLRVEGRLATVANRRGEWLLCLRLLDADEAGAADPSIARLLFGDAAARAEVASLRRRARDLMQGRYRCIPLLSES